MNLLHLGTHILNAGAPEAPLDTPSGKPNPQGNGRTTHTPEAVARQDKAVLEAVKPMLDKLAPSVVTLGDGKKTLAKGTIIHADGFILTKHSEIAKAKEILKVLLSDGREFTGTEVTRFADHDLALVKITADSLPAITITETRKALELGTFLFTPGGSPKDSLLTMGVLGVKERTLKEAGGFLGISFTQGENSLEIDAIMPQSPAAQAGLLKKDEILAMNGQLIEDMEQMVSLIRSLPPGTRTRIKYRRDGEEKTAKVTIGDRSQKIKNRNPHNPGTIFGTDVSDRFSDFPLIFQHDQPLKPEECGGIIADLHGNVVGVNIARADRVSSYAIPIATVAELLKTVDFNALAENPPG